MVSACPRAGKQLIGSLGMLAYHALIAQPHPDGYGEVA